MPADRRNAGFSLVELLIVVAIIVIMAAVALPNIGRYIRNYRIKAATQQIAGELQSARMKAVSKNVNLGVVFAILSNNPATYRYVIEEDLNPQGGAPHPWTTIATEGGAAGWPAVLADPVQAGPLRTLPAGTQFDSPVNCRWPTAAGGPAPTSWGLRFGRLGGACRFVGTGAGTCLPAPPSAPAYTNYIGFSADGSANICLLETSTNLRRAITVTVGGRILVQP